MVLTHSHIYLQFKPFVWVGLNTFFIYLMAAAGAPIAPQSLKRLKCSTDIFDSVLQWFYWSNPKCPFGPSKID